MKENQMREESKRKKNNNNNKYWSSQPINRILKINKTIKDIYVNTINR